MRRPCAAGDDGTFSHSQLCHHTAFISGHRQKKTKHHCSELISNEPQIKVKSLEGVLNSSKSSHPNKRQLFRQSLIPIKQNLQKACVRGEIHAGDYITRRGGDGLRRRTGCQESGTSSAAPSDPHVRVRHRPRRPGRSDPREATRPERGAPSLLPDLTPTRCSKSLLCVINYSSNYVWTATVQSQPP